MSLVTRNMKNGKNILTFILLIIPAIVFGQGLSLSLSSTQNEICNGFGCRYNGPTILINEVMMRPRLFDSSIKGCPSGFDPSNSCEGEWIELYNPHHCEPVDISCYFLGNSAPDAGPDGVKVYSAGFIIPEGTIIPPRGFAIVRGRKAPPVPAHLLVTNGGNTIEIIVEDDNRIYIEGYRFWFPNAGGWFAFYDENGIPQDAIAWGPNHQGADVNAYNPGVVGACGYTGPLINYNQILDNRKNVISYIEPDEGKTFRRVPDGGSWDFNQPADETYGTCNTTCIQPYLPTCNGTATVTITGGIPPYTILWNDGNDQPTATAIGLCEGNYCVTVTDANYNTVQGCVEVKNQEPHVTISSSLPAYCEGTEIHLYANTFQGKSPYTFSWEGPDDFISKEQNPVIVDAEKNNTGIYYVTAYDSNQCKKTESIQIDILSSPILEIVNASPYCEGDDIILSLSDTMEINNIEWTTSQNKKIKETNLLIINASTSNSGEYSVNATAVNGCTVQPAHLNLEINEVPQVNLGNDRKICEGSIVLDAGNSSYTHLWSTGETTSRITVGNSGNYWVKVTNNGCEGTDDVIVQSIKPELELMSEGDLCEDKQVLLWITTNADSVLWNTGFTSDTLLVRHQGAYEVTAVIEGCDISRSISLTCPCDMIFPNAFIPSSIDLNATFGPAESYWITLYHLFIYDRWGNLIFETTSIDERWDGKVKGEDAPQGAYVYVAYYLCQGNSAFQEKHGTVLLIR